MPQNRFEDREGVAEALGLPNHVLFSIIGPPGEAYRRALFAAIEESAGLGSITSHEENASRTGKYVAYRLKIYLESIEDVEAIYDVAARVEGTKRII